MPHDFGPGQGRLCMKSRKAVYSTKNALSFKNFPAFRGIHSLFVGNHPAIEASSTIRVGSSFRYHTKSIIASSVYICALAAIVQQWD